jgi:hypothetical protein
MKIVKRIVYQPTLLNYLFFVVGMLGVWFTTHNFTALLFTLIASIHISIGVEGVKKIIK